MSGATISHRYRTLSTGQVLGDNDQLSQTLSTKGGSVDSVKVSLRCGCRETKCGARWRLTGRRPSPSPRVLQGVGRVGMVSSVAVAISVILSSPILRGAPGHGSSVRPSIRLGAPSGIQSVAAEAQLHRSARRRWHRQSACLLSTVEPKAARGDRVKSQPAAQVYRTGPGSACFGGPPAGTARGSGRHKSPDRHRHMSNSRQRCTPRARIAVEGAHAARHRTRRGSDGEDVLGDRTTRARDAAAG